MLLDSYAIDPSSQDLSHSSRRSSGLVALVFTTSIHIGGFNAECKARGEDSLSFWWWHLLPIILVVFGY